MDPKLIPQFKGERRPLLETEGELHDFISEENNQGFTRSRLTRHIHKHVILAIKPSSDF